MAREMNGNFSSFGSYPPTPFRSSLACCSAFFAACLALASGFS